MKNQFLIYIGLILYLTFASCEKGFDEFLDKSPGVDVTEDIVFSSKSQIETFVAGTYADGIHTGYPMGSTPTGYTHQNITEAATDAGEMGDTWYPSQSWNSGSVIANNILNQEDVRFYKRWQVIRRTNILLERMETVTSVEPDYINQVKGEAKFVRALNYFEMFKRYGGVPIVDKRFQLTDEMKIQRANVEDVINFIVKDCDDAIASLPSTYPPTSRGRANKGAALILKSKALLFAASPMFNTATPYMDFGANNKLICYGNYDLARWQKAADAAKAVIDWASGANCTLVTNQGVDKNYKYVWEKHDNSEVILAYKGTSTVSMWTWPWVAIMSRNIYYGWGGLTVPLNFVKFYEKKDGTPQVWNPAGGNDLNLKYSELDSRFAQTMAYNGSRWNNDYPKMQMHQGGPDAPNCYGGVWLHKLVPDGLNYSNQNVVPHWINFRLAEAYLNYAEALNEAQGSVQEAYDAVNVIRARSGMPDLPAGLSKDDFRIRVRNERNVELAYEDHRFWDIRRWLIAEEEGVMKGNMWGIKINKIVNSTEHRYEPFVFEVRTFQSRMYLHPFIQNEVYKGYLVQNPGW